MLHSSIPGDAQGTLKDLQPATECRLRSLPGKGQICKTYVTHYSGAWCHHPLQQRWSQVS